MMKRAILLMMLVLQTCPTSPSKILMVQPMGSISHKNVFMPMLHKLISKGHQVTMASLFKSPDQLKSTDRYFIDAVAVETRNFMEGIIGDMNIFATDEEASNARSFVVKKVIPNINRFCDSFLRDPAIKQVWENKPDLILLTATLNECGLAFVHKFKVPFIYVSTSGLMTWVSSNMGNPENPSYVPNQVLPYFNEMTFTQRLINAYASIFLPLLRKHFILNELDRTIQEFLNDASFSTEKVDRNVSLTLVNSHHSFTSARPLLTNIVEVGGMHCREPKDLSGIDRQLKAFLDSAGDRQVVLFSLGSVINSKDMPQELLDKFVAAFNELPFKVVWKYEAPIPVNEAPSSLNEAPIPLNEAPMRLNEAPIPLNEAPSPLNVSSNVLIRSWLPQQDILGHPSVGCFFSHAGMLSLQEAIYHGVPMVALPLVSDQLLNANIVVNNGIGLQLALKTLSADGIVRAITDVMTASCYSEKVATLSARFKDNELHPVDLSVYWVEYVLRHKGAPHLVPPSASIPFYQYYLLDVITFCVAVLTITVYGSFKIMVIIMRSVLRRLYMLLS